MTGVQFKLMSEWALKIPAMEKEIEFECEKCGTKNSQTLRGLVDFLAGLSHETLVNYYKTNFDDATSSL